MLPPERALLDGIRQFGNVFRFKLFDAKGRLRLLSEDLHIDARNDQELVEHTDKADIVIRTGKPQTEINDGTEKPDRPDLYVES
ncbi:MAG: hypothetical protein OEL78_01830, partial [Hyphomicrobiales bacterium]|nr:hypothetical protein [Hyphomicrobiales bacterium]